MIIFGRQIAAKALAVTLAGVFVVLLLIFAVSQCDKRRSQAAQSRVDRSQAEAAQNSAADAIGIVQRSGEAAAASEELGRQNERDIRAAEGADAHVGAGVNAAGRAALCKRAAYRNDPKCKGVVR